MAQSLAEECRVSDDRYADRIHKWDGFLNPFTRDETVHIATLSMGLAPGDKAYCLIRFINDYV
ncbi:hypothetical protein GCM10007886_09870 [Methylobacterium gregans]|nr:hypothetical protein GCM10007886_09870 [Methylobacterium gregans]